MLQGAERERHLSSLSCEVHDKLLHILDGGHIPTKDRDASDKRAYRVYYPFKSFLSSNMVKNPLSGVMEKRVIYHPQSGDPDRRVIVLKASEKNPCIQFYYDRCKAESARKLKRRIDTAFCGVSEREIQLFINNCKRSQQVKGKFENKAKLKPVTAKRVWTQVQIDLMSMTDMPVIIEKKKYQWILSCIDIFSRYLVLRPIHSKDTAVVSDQLLQIFADLGTPSIIQSDRGSEFLGCVTKLAKLLKVKIVHSSVRHPQSQGKVNFCLLIQQVLSEN